MTNTPCDNCVALAMCMNKPIVDILNCPLLTKFFTMLAYDLAHSLKISKVVKFDIYGDNDITFRICEISLTGRFYFMSVSPYKREHVTYEDALKIKVRRQDFNENY